MARLKVYLAGHFRATLDDQPLSSFRSAKVEALLAYLVLEGGVLLPRPHLAELLWSGYASKTARASLRVALSNLRQILAPLTLLQTNNRTVLFRNRHPDFWCDLLSLESTEISTKPMHPTQGIVPTRGLLVGLETVDSAPFQHWLAEKRVYYDQIVEQWQERPLPATVGQTVSIRGRLGEQARSLTRLEAQNNDDTKHQFEAPPIAIDNQVPDLGPCYSRTTELKQLERWLVAEQARLIVILGIGGQGKTLLAATLAHRLAANSEAPPPFERILWSSLLNAPPLAELLKHWLSLVDVPGGEFPAGIDRQLDLLLEWLDGQRCLIILDNVESIMLAGARAGYYRPGYEEYGQLLQRIATGKHQSAVVLTSREEPHGFKRLELSIAACRSMRLSGLSSAAGAQIVADAGLAGTPAEMEELVTRYSGNPLAIKLIIATIQEHFANNIQSFLASKLTVFDDIRDLLDQQFARLQPIERTLLYWLAIEREAVSFDLLNQNLIGSYPRWATLEAIRSLIRRSLIEQIGGRAALQNVITEYVTDRLVETIGDELVHFCAEYSTALEPLPNNQSHPTVAINGTLIDSHLNHFALVKAQSKEYVRVSQVRMLLQPVADHIVATWGESAIGDRLQWLLDQLRDVIPLTPSYAAANLLHLLQQLQSDLRGFDFSRLVLRQADLRKVNLKGVNLREANLSQCLYTEPMEIARCLTVSPDGELLAIGHADGHIQLWGLTDQRRVGTLKAHQGPIYSVSFSPDGRWLASGGADDMVCLWDLATHKRRCRMYGHVAEVLQVAFTADGQSLFSLSQDNAFHRWEMQTLLQSPEYTLPHHYCASEPTDNIYRSAASSTLAIGGGDTNVIYCWDVENGHRRATLYETGTIIIALAATPDGKLIASSSNDPAIRVWALNDDVTETSYTEPIAVLPMPANALAFSPNGRLLASAYDNYLCVWEVDSGKLCWRVDGHQERITMLAFTPSGNTIISTGYDQTTRFWDAKSGQIEFMLYGLTKWMEFPKFSPDGQSLVSSVAASSHLWTCAGHHLHALRGHHGMVQHYAYSHDSRLMATSGGAMTTILLWDVSSGKHRHTLDRHTDVIMANLAVKPDCNLLATGSADKTICLWDMSTGELRKVLQGHKGSIRYIAFSLTGDRLATASSDCTVGIWSISSGQLTHILHGHDALCTIIAFHPNNRLLVSGSEDNTVRLWDTSTGELVQCLTGHTQSILYVNFSPNGRWLVSLSADQTLRIWQIDLTSGQYKLRHTLAEHIFKLSCAIYTPDGRSLVTGSMDTTVRLWNLEEGQVRHAFKGHSNIITGVDISPNGQEIASSSSDGTIRLWDIERGTCLHTLRPEGPYAGMNISGVTGITPAQKAALIALGAIEDQA